MVAFVSPFWVFFKDLAENGATTAEMVLVEKQQMVPVEKHKVRVKSRAGIWVIG